MLNLLLLPSLLLPGQPHRGQGVMGLSSRWAGAGREAVSQTRVPWEGSLEGEFQNSAAQLPLSRALASVVGDWMQNLVRSSASPYILPCSG